MNNNISQVPYLITSRDFPEDGKELSVVLNRAYIDIANAVNSRTIGIFTLNKPTITGEVWNMTSNTRFQSFRQVYTFTSTSDISIGFKFSKVSSFIKFTGTFTDGTSWFGLIPASSLAIAGQISFYLTTGSATSDVIKFVTGAGAPTLTSGTIVIEWLSKI